MLNTILNDISWSCLTFNMIQTSVKWLFIVICLLVRSKRWMAINAESFMQQKVNPNSMEDDSENLSHFGFGKNCRIPTTFRFRFELQHIPSKFLIKLPSEISTL